MNVSSTPPVKAPDVNFIETSGDSTPEWPSQRGGQTNGTSAKKGRMELPPFWTDWETEIARLAKLIEEQATVKRETKLDMKEVTKMFPRVQQGEASKGN